MSPRPQPDKAKARGASRGWFPFLGLRLGLLVTLFASLTFADTLDDLLRDVRAVQAEGVGSAKARAAWDRLVRQGPGALPRILVAMDTPDTVVANWLRLAFDDIAERESKSIDAEALLAFVRDGKRHGAPRRFALEHVELLRPGTKDKLLADWLTDPEFGHDAVGRALEQIQRDKDLPKEKAVERLRSVFAASRDLEQARTAATRLKERGVIVSLADHMGFLRDWYVIGPFDANRKKGYGTTYPPEKSVDLKATLEGKGGKKLTWVRHTLPDSLTGRFPGFVDLRKPLGDAEDAVAFAWTAVECPREQTVELRGAADDNFTLWVNGTRVFGFEEYQNGVRLDRHRVAVKLRAGVNTILVKICQAPLDADNTLPNWEFLLRITDASGKGVTFPRAEVMR